MSDVLKHRKLATRSGKGGPQDEEDIKCYPSLSLLLAGVWDDQKGCFTVPPHSVTIWREGDRLKACVGAGENESKWWGTINALTHSLEDIEALLSVGKGEWREPKNEKRPGTYHKF